MLPAASAEAVQKPMVTFQASAKVALPAFRRDSRGACGTVMDSCSLSSCTVDNAPAGWSAALTALRRQTHEAELLQRV